jgi:anti-sigma regulatory factor (Ser/Thr protein kinase)
MTMADKKKRLGAPGAQLRLFVLPDPKAGGYVRQAVIAFAQNQGILGDEVIDFVTAVGEALANAIEHSHTQEPIEIAAWTLGKDRLFASVRDRGVGFAATERMLKPPLPEGFAERGRGLPIMRKCADVFSVRTAPGQGTRVTLGCRVHRAAGAHVQHIAG